MIKKIYKKYEIIFNVVLFSIFPIAAFYLMEFYEHNPFEEVRFMAGFFNIILFELIAWILYFVTGRAKWALRAVFIVAMVFGLINHYVMLFRSTPFVPWDIFSIGTATSVASNYDFAPTAGVVVVTVIFIALIMLMHFVDFRIKWKFRFRLIPTVLGILALCLFVNALQDEDFQTDNYLYPFLFTPAYMTKVNGMAVTFAMDLKFVAVDKPDGYSRQKAKELLDSYTGTDDNTAITDKSDYPNIIVVMDEAFSDLSVLGGFDTNTDYMPFVHSLEKGNENTITGYLNTSVCGGNTADTEFEFLTGNTMAFLPVGSIPYQQYIKSKTPSLASYLKSIGYATYAQHPYYSSGWNRDTVYPLLGFDNLSFMQDYSNQRFVREYISDETSFDKIIETYENKPDGQPAFIFNVTMQNHGGYTDTYYGFDNTVTADKLNNSALDQYLSLIKLTDEDLKNLIEYFSNVDEKTIVVFFGDHQPNDTVASSVLAANGMDYNNLSNEELKLRYQVPYVIWANYDIDEATGKDTSVNYLAANVLKAAGVPTNDYQSFLLKLQEEYPIISAVRTDKTADKTLDKASNKSDKATGSKKKQADSDMLNDYKLLQYYRLFDWEDK
ncbi:LTA synthase family protein [Agathobacter rectalis]|uniref:LTA synthase family protein n=1 Tax=Agathobacter rectalis TaxID=39491 RepID=A0A414ZPF9_9FIRM|nr:LTA synthase family protein [Agathobacter rectalis]RHI25110.1 LTA synthase family protein [Agathobacter rectalis]